MSGNIFVLKICQTAAGTSMIRQSHEFSNLNFGRFLSLGPTEGLAMSAVWPFFGKPPGKP